MRRSTRRAFILSFLLSATLSGPGIVATEPVVERECTILDLAEIKKSRFVLTPTAAGGAASGTVRASAAGSGFHLRVDVRDLPPAEQVGYQFLTHVLWRVDGGGSFVSLGELPTRNGNARVDVAVEGPAFGLWVTAEPYFSVERPSGAVLLTTNVDKNSTKRVEVASATCLAVDGEYYTFGRDGVAVALALRRDPKTPAELLQARHAFKIAELAGGSKYRPDEYRSAAAQLLEAENSQASRAGNPTAVAASREVVFAAEALRAQSEDEAAAVRDAAAQRAAAAREAELLAAEERQRRESAQASERAAQARRLEEETQKRLEAERIAQRLENERAAASIDAGYREAIGDGSLAAERARLAAERARLDAERQKLEADNTAERARIESERATLHAQLAEENATRDDNNASVRAEVEQARREAEQARLEAEAARREAELAAERARIEVERAQLEAQKTTLASEAALREQLRNEAAQQSAVRTDADRQAEMERMRQQLELEMLQRELEHEREALAVQQMAEQQAVEQNRAQLDTEREQIVAQLQADQALLAEERAEMERLRREDEARRGTEAQLEAEERERQLAAERAELQAALEAERRRMDVERSQLQSELEAEQRQLQQELDAERARMRAEMDAERERLRQDFDRQREDIARGAEAAEAERVLQAETERATRRTTLLNQLKEVLEAGDTERGLLVSLSGVSFAPGQHELHPDAREKLARVAGILLANPSLVVTIEGHTDSTGSAEGNLALSERRAHAVRDYFVSQGVSAESMSARGLGASVPIAPNETAAGRRANRRIEFLISGAAIDR